jgi:hypothetical protein
MKMPSQPVIAFLMDSLSHRSASATSAPFSLSAKAFSEAVLRVIARGVKVPSDRSAFTPADPIFPKKNLSEIPSQVDKSRDRKTLG